MKPISLTLLLVALCTLAGAAAAQPQNIPPGIAEDWMGEYKHAAGQVEALAEKVPADKYAWRPAPGVRSVSEVYMHIAIANYFFLSSVGVPEAAEAMKKLTPTTEKDMTAKADVVKYLKASQDLVRSSYPNLDLKKKVKFLGKDTTVEGVMLRLVVHVNEHMGQSVAYARVNGVVPPWSE